MNEFIFTLTIFVVSFFCGYIARIFVSGAQKKMSNINSAYRSGETSWCKTDDSVKDQLLLEIMGERTLFSQDLTRSLKRITEAGSKILNCGRVSVWFYNDDFTILRCMDLYMADKDEHKYGEELRSSDFPSYVNAHISNLIISAGDVYTDPRTREIPEQYFRENSITSLLDSAIRSRNRLYGVFSFEHTGKKRNWSRDDEKFALLLTNLVSLCIEADRRTLTEKELLETERQLINAGDNLVGGMIYRVIVRKNGMRNFTFVSAGVKMLHELTPEQIMEDPDLLYSQVHEDDIEKMKQREKYSIEHMSTFDIEVRFRYPEGGIRWSRIFSHPTLMRNGDIAFDGMEIDITDRKINEALLIEKEESLRITLDSIGDAVISTNINGKIVRMNPAAATLTGWNPADAQGRDINEVFRIMDPDNHLREVNPVGEVLQTGEVVFLEEDTILISRDGSEHMIMDSAAPIINDDGETAGVVLVFRDITEQFRLERESLQNAFIFRTIFETSPYSIVIQSAKDSRYVLVNPAFLSVSGLKKEDIIGKTMADIGRRVDPDDERRAVELLRDTGKIDNMVIKSKGRKDDDVYTLFSSRIVEFNGETCILSVTIDITETKRMQEQLNHIQKMDAIGQLAGGIAHDFNNMLGGIMGAAELLLNRAGSDEKLLKYIYMIRTTAERAASLTGKLLAFSRKSDIEKMPVDLHKVIRDAAELLARTIDKKISINLLLNSEQYTVSGDISQLMNVFINLGINAGHSMPDGGELTFSTRVVELDEHYCSLNSPDLKPGMYLVTEVQDTGCGIPPENLGRIFEPFFTTREKGKGTGMGLASVYGTVRQHHGLISVYSEPGKGSIFHLYLPLPECGSAERSDVKDIIRGSGCILVIDDEEIMRVTAVELLKYLGYDAIVAADGKEGAEIYAGEHDSIDLVLLDMVMPVMNGRECFRELKRINPEVKVVISSGFVLDESLNELRSEGLAGFIKKPFQTADLSRIIADAMSEKIEGDTVCLD